MNVILYHRVSTVKQGQSGLGLEAQQALVHNYLKNRPHTILKEFVEVQSSNRKKNKERPMLKEALHLCKEHNATLVVAKLDRMHRNVYATAALIESGIDFICVDNPNVTKFTLQILSCVAEKELEDISLRTSAALQAKKARGDKLGNPQNFTSEHRRLGAMSVNRKKAVQADTFALKMYPTISYLLNSKHYSVYQVAKELNATNYPTASGKVSVWDITKVKHCMQRVEASVAQQHKGGDMP